MPNFTALDMSLPEVATLVAAMVQARDAVSRRSWSHPQATAAHRSSGQASVLSARRRKARDHTCRLQQVRLAGCVFARRAHRLAWSGLRDAQLTRPSGRTKLQQARL